MKQASVLISAVVAATALFVAATPAHAESIITYAAESGTNTPDCDTIVGACTSLASAVASTTEGGIMRCSGPVQAVPAFSISKSITIDCTLGAGGVNILALTIIAPGKTVILRNVDINCAGKCGHVQPVINITAADRVVLDNVSVGGGSAFFPAIYDHRAGPGYLVISNSKIEANGGPGIVIAPNGGNIGVVLDNVRSSNNTYGLGVGAGGRVTIKRSVFSANSVSGIQADTGAIIDVNETLISHNSTGIAALNGSTVALSNSNLDSNNTAVNGAWATFGNNRLFANLGSGTAPTAVGAATFDLGQR